jgi:hypothetical protein
MRAYMHVRDDMRINRDARVSGVERIGSGTDTDDWRWLLLTRVATRAHRHLAQWSAPSPSPIHRSIRTLSHRSDDSAENDQRVESHADQ